MTHDFAKKKAASRPRKAASQKKKPAPKATGNSWIWLFSGIVIGVGITLLALFAGVLPSNNDNLLDKTREVADQARQAGEDITTRFDFYTLLPEREILVPEESEDNSGPTEQYQYILQAGSFKSSKDADRLRAELILLGLEVQTEAVRGGNGERWHRVQVGPFVSRSKLAKARGILIGEGYDTLLLKRKIDD